MSECGGSVKVQGNVYVRGKCEEIRRGCDTIFSLVCVMVKDSVLKWQGVLTLKKKVKAHHEVHGRKH